MGGAALLFTIPYCCIIFQTWLLLLTKYILLQFAPIMPAFCSLLLPSYFSKNYAGKIGTSLQLKDINLHETLTQTHNKVRCVYMHALIITIYHVTLSTYTYSVEGLNYAVPRAVHEP